MGGHNEQMEEIYGEGNRTVPGMRRRRRAGPRLAGDLRAARGDRPGPAALPRADRRRRPRGRSLGRRGAPGPRPQPPLGRPPLPARGARHVRRRRAARSRPAPTSRSSSSAPPGSTTGSRADAARRAPRGPAGEARPRRRARRRGRDRRRGADRGRPPDRLDDPGAADDRRPRAAARPAAPASGSRCAGSPTTPGHVPAGAFPAAGSRPPDDRGQRADEALRRSGRGARTSPSAASPGP